MSSYYRQIVKSGQGAQVQLILGVGAPPGGRRGSGESGVSRLWRPQNQSSHIAVPMGGMDKGRRRRGAAWKDQVGRSSVFAGVALTVTAIVLAATYLGGHVQGPTPNRHPLRPTHVLSAPDLTSGMGAVAPRAALANSLSESVLPPCDWTNFSVTAGAATAYHGRAGQQFILSYVGPTCSVGGFPAVAGLTTSNGSRLSTAIRPDPEYGQDPVTLTTGDAANIVLSSPGDCAGVGAADDPIVTAATISLGSSRSFTVPGLNLDVRCADLAVSAIRFFRAASQDTAGSTAGLTAELSSFSAAHPGTTMTYVLTLRNPRSAPYRFRAGCPVFTEVFNGGERATAASFFLNCVPINMIGPRTAVRLRMRMTIPASARAGPAKVGWLMDGGVTTGAVVNVSR